MPPARQRVSSGAALAVPNTEQVLAYLVCVLSLLMILVLAMPVASRSWLGRTAADTQAGTSSCLAVIPAAFFNTPGRLC